jgi:twitching motility two-component system response regulator PilH
MTIRKVLVVDDSATELTHLQTIVAATGCAVLSARNGREAVALAKAEKPDVIFMDILMPEMDGYEATRRLGNDAATRDIPVVFVSSKRQRADRLWAQMQGGKGFITKPFHPDQIVDQLKTLQ